MLELFGNACLLVGAAFFFAGTAGLLRFPDLYTRLHVLAKVDNVALGFTVLGLLPRANSFSEALGLVLVWLLSLAASAVVGFVIARRASAHGIVPWQADKEHA